MQKTNPGILNYMLSKRGGRSESIGSGNLSNLQLAVPVVWAGGNPWEAGL